MGKGREGGKEEGGKAYLQSLLVVLMSDLHLGPGAVDAG